MSQNHSLFWMIILFYFSIGHVQNQFFGTDVQDLQKSTETELVKLFPNSIITGNTIDLTFGWSITAELTVYDLTGKLIMSDNIENNSTKRLDVFNLINNGIYPFKIKTGSTTIA